MNEEQKHSEHVSERHKQVSEFIQEQFGTIEQQPPNHPSFLFVVLLSAAVLIVIFIIALVILHSGGASFTRHSFHKHPTSRLVMPAPAQAPSAVRWSA